MSFWIEEPLWLLGIPLALVLFLLGLRLRSRFTYVPVLRRCSSPWLAHLTLIWTLMTGSGICLVLSRPTLAVARERPILPSLWVLWDASYSMRETDTWPDRRRLALRLWETALDTLLLQNAQASFGLIVFAHGVHGLLPKTHDLETFRWALRQAVSLDLGEGTDLAQAVEVALTHSEPGQNLFIVSDGAHNNPLSADLRILAEKAAERSIPIHALFVGRDSATTFPEALAYLTQRTGGYLWENTFSLRPLSKPEKAPLPYALHDLFLWLALASAFLMGLSLALGWFNLLSA